MGQKEPLPSPAHPAPEAPARPPLAHPAREWTLRGRRAVWTAQHGRSHQGARPLWGSLPFVKSTGQGAEHLDPDSAPRSLNVPGVTAGSCRLDTGVLAEVRPGQGSWPRPRERSCPTAMGGDPGPLLEHTQIPRPSAPGLTCGHRDRHPRCRHSRGSGWGGALRRQGSARQLQVIETKQETPLHLNFVQKNPLGTQKC